MIIHELQSHALPHLRVVTQPDADRLVVGLPTNFYVDAEKETGTLWFFDHTVAVDFETTPDQFTWIFGDGDQRTTTEPGRRYPTMDITHEYGARDTYVARVDVEWGHVRFRVRGGDWVDSDQHPATQGEPVTISIDSLHSRLGDSR